jgi:hypothetical protein
MLREEQGKERKAGIFRDEEKNKNRVMKVEGKE